MMMVAGHVVLADDEDGTHDYESDCKLCNQTLTGNAVW